jgi:hypothetical protein
VSGRKFWKGETAAIVRAMKATGNRPGIVAEWKAKVAQWAQMNRTDPNAAAVNAWLPMWQPRPFYTAEELAPMWPALAIAVGHTTHWPNVLKSPKRLEHELDFAGLPYFRTRGRKYYIVECIHIWKNASQEDRENALAQ